MYDRTLIILYKMYNRYYSLYFHFRYQFYDSWLSKQLKAKKERLPRCDLTSAGGCQQSPKFARWKPPLQILVLKAYPIERL